MPKYYRFISKAEHQALITNKVVTNINNAPLHILPEKPTAFITPNAVNYSISIEDLLASNYPRKTDFTKEVFLAYMIGTISHDYLIELDLPSPPSMSNLGWYYNDEDTELCLVEYCIAQYSLDQVTNIYTGDFHDWQGVRSIYTKQTD